jgi:methyltransferase-like protein
MTVKITEKNHQEILTQFQTHIQSLSTIVQETTTMLTKENLQTNINVYSSKLQEFLATSDAFLEILGLKAHSCLPVLVKEPKLSESVFDEKSKARNKSCQTKVVDSQDKGC